MSTAIVPRGDGSPDRVYEAIEAEFFKHAVRYIREDDGTTYMVIDDVIRALGPDTFDREFINLRVIRLGVRRRVRTWSGVETVIVGGQDAINRILLETRSELGDKFRDWVTPIVTQVQQTGGFLPAELANDPIIRIRMDQIALEKRVKAVEASAEDAKAIAQGVEAQVNNISGFKTLLAYSVERGLEIPPPLLLKESKMLARRCRDEGIAYHKVDDHRWPGGVNIYPIRLLDEWYPGFAARYPECKKKPWFRWR